MSKDMNTSGFYKSFVLLILLLLGSSSLDAKQIGNRLQGSASALEGTIYVLTCYVSETGWSPEEVESYSAMINEAEEWLVTQAANYGKEVTFVNGTAGLDVVVG